MKTSMLFLRAFSKNIYFALKEISPEQMGQNSATPTPSTTPLLFKSASPPTQFGVDV